MSTKEIKSRWGPYSSRQRLQTFYSSLSCATSNDVSHSSSFHTEAQSAATLQPELRPEVASPRFHCLRLQLQCWHRDRTISTPGASRSEASSFLLRSVRMVMSLRLLQQSQMSSREHVWLSPMHKLTARPTTAREMDEVP